jgi:hypothetical protein
MLTIYRVTHRYYYGTHRPHECSDNTVNYFDSIEKARQCVKDFLGEEATVDNDFGFDIWVSKHLPHTEYIIDCIRVY